MNAESVIKVCHETMKHIKEKNPKVDININALLPELPFKNASSSEDIAHADTLLVRIYDLYLCIEITHLK
jgi:hypothetical protein